MNARGKGSEEQGSPAHRGEYRQAAGVSCAGGSARSDKPRAELALKQLIYIDINGKK
jgi:hypothetical protein